MTYTLTPGDRAEQAGATIQVEALYACAVCGHEDQLPADVHICPCCDGIRLQLKEHVDAERKAFFTLQARAALIGHQLVSVGAGFMLSRGTHSRHFADLATAEVLIEEGGIA